MTANRKEDSGFFILSTQPQCAKRATYGGLKRNLQGLYDTGDFSLSSNWSLAKFYLRAFLILTAILFLFFFCTAKSQASIIHFSQKDFSCKCCGQVKINQRLLNDLEILRGRVNQPIIITSGYRCPKHNREVGGAKYSRHTLGKAVDIKIKGMSPAQVAKLAKQCGFTWTKTYPSWTHIDIR
jgi:hypothetical protein